MSTLLFSKTPTITVVDNRGLSVRDIAYYRYPETPNNTEQRITNVLLTISTIPAVFWRKVPIRAYMKSV